MATHDRVDTTAGSWALLGSKVPRDAYTVSRLREAGAVILGHSNMSEWSSSKSKTYSTGFSPRRGQTRNPFDLSKSPCKGILSIVGSLADVRRKSGRALGLLSLCQQIMCLWRSAQVCLCQAAQSKFDRGLMVR